MFYSCESTAIMFLSILVLANVASNFLSSFFFFFFFQSNLIGSESSSLSALNMSEDGYLEDNIMDNSFASSHLPQSPHSKVAEGSTPPQQSEGDGESRLTVWSAQA